MGRRLPIKPAPTPAEQAHAMVAATPPDKMDFAQWEFVLTNGTQEDQDMVWNAIKGKAVQMNGTIISTDSRRVHDRRQFRRYRREEGGHHAEVRRKGSGEMIPKDGASFDFQGEPAPTRRIRS